MKPVRQLNIVSEPDNLQNHPNLTVSLKFYPEKYAMLAGSRQHLEPVGGNDVHGVRGKGAEDRQRGSVT
jgi:hypothetical protein